MLPLLPLSSICIKKLSPMQPRKTLDCLHSAMVPMWLKSPVRTKAYERVVLGYPPLPLGRMVCNRPQCCETNIAFALDQKSPDGSVCFTLDLCMDDETLCKQVQLPFFLVLLEHYSSHSWYPVNLCDPDHSRNSLTANRLPAHVGISLSAGTNPKTSDTRSGFSPQTPTTVPEAAGSRALFLFPEVPGFQLPPSASPCLLPSLTPSFFPAGALEKPLQSSCRSPEVTPGVAEPACFHRGT